MEALEIAHAIYFTKSIGVQNVIVKGESKATIDSLNPTESNPSMVDHFD